MSADDWLIENAGVPDLEHTVRSLQAENARLRELATGAELDDVALRATVEQLRDTLRRAPNGSHGGQCSVWRGAHCCDCVLNAWQKERAALLAPEDPR